MKKVIRLTESELTEIISEAIQKELLQEADFNQIKNTPNCSTKSNNDLRDGVIKHMAVKQQVKSAPSSRLAAIKSGAPALQGTTSGSMEEFLYVEKNGKPFCRLR